MSFSEKQWKNTLLEIFKTPFDAQEAHQEMAPYRKKIEDQNIKNAIRCAVGIHIFFEEEPKLILIERPLTMRKHAGQIAFPGGKMDQSDANLLETANRESEEELGINRNEAKNIGELNPIFIPVTNYLVSPFVFIHEEKPVLNVNDLEVNDFLFISFSQLIHPTSRTKRRIHLEEGKWLSDVPCFEMENKIIWGATSLILNELKERIMPFLQPTV
jgi:8-oxo-dGTP pyrophosphatase MutT (NUDIX family)